MKHTRLFLGLGLLVLASCGRANAPPPAGGDRGAISQPPVNAPVSVRLASGLIDQRPDRGMRERVDAAGADLAVCRAELEAARVTFTPVPDRVDSETCGLAGAGTLDVDRGTVARLSPAAPVMTCQTALALSVWRRQVVEPAAREIFGQDVVDIVHYGTFACRTV
ncbi:MAG: extensin family protein, partial [Brevundimonas sp.]|nr:extensin family protein [Brevundimonas sp.]